MNYDEVKEKISSELKNSWDSFQETSLYNKIKDRYENLSPAGQKAALIGTIAAIILIIFSIPYGYYSTSSTYEEEFSAKRELIRDLLKTSRETSADLDLEGAPDLQTALSRIQSEIQMARLLPEQVGGINSSSESSPLIPQDLSAGVVEVELKKLNLKQLVDIGYALQNISKTVKLKDMFFQSNSADSRYVDVKYRLSVVANPSGSETENAAPPGRGRR